MTELLWIGYTAAGKRVLPQPVTAQINRELGVPADDLTVTFYGDEIPALRRIDVIESRFHDIGQAIKGGGVVFRGIVDEYIRNADAFGRTVTICARSLAALPLDNECESCEYRSPSPMLLFSRHLERFGIVCGESLSGAAGGVLKVGRGMSHYGAVERFCVNFLHTIPRIDSAGVFRFDALSQGDPVIFSNSGGIAFRRMTVSEKRCSRVSSVIAEQGARTAAVKNSAAVNDGIERVRRINLLDSPTGTLSDAQALIDSGERESYSVRIYCPCRLPDLIGAEAVCAEAVPDGMKMYISKMKYTVSADGGETVVTLAKKEGVTR